MSAAPDGASQAAQLFSRAFGAAPAVVASAPGRVNLIGEHTDYNGGDVLPIAIAQRTYVAARRNGGERVRAVSASASEAGEFALGGARAEGKWWDYIAGVAMHLRARGHAIAGADLAVWSDVPAGAGLGSSAALAIAAGMALARASGSDVDARELARAAREAEAAFVGVEVGIMDQFACALGVAGHALRIRCASEEVTPVAFGGSVLIFDTRVRRSLRDGRFNARREECARALALLRRTNPELRHLAEATPEMVQGAALPAPLDARARHVATEMARVESTFAALRRGAAIPPELLYASHASLRDDFACSCAELDWFVAIAGTMGLRGARMTGAGWGGCAIALDTREMLEAAVPTIARGYHAAHGRKPQWWITRASEGAGFSPYPRR